MEYEVAAVPTFIFFRAGEILDRVEGAKAADVTKIVRNLVTQKFQLPSQQGLLSIKLIFSKSSGYSLPL